MRTIILAWVLIAGVRAAPVDDFIEAAREHHGAAGEEAARFLAEHMPVADRQSLTADFLIENLDLAFKSRAEFPWARTVSNEVFLNDVLPYAVFDEVRDPWRVDFLERARPLVKEAKTAGEAVQILNREFFKQIKVHYHTGRKAPNQSPKESMETGRATCTGLSIILVNACRAVGIPARAVGTPQWANGRGNHTWVEVWDGGWHFTGADEYDPKGLDRGWFTGDAAQAEATSHQLAIYATSWKKEGLSFPLVWSQGSQNVAAVNVTARYAKPRTGPAASRLGVRLFGEPGGDRQIATVRVIDGSGSDANEQKTKAGVTDLNDMPRFGLPLGAAGRLVFTRGDEAREMVFGPLTEGDSTVDAVWSRMAVCSPAITALQQWLAGPRAQRLIDSPALRLPLSRKDADAAVAMLGSDCLSRLGEERKDEMEKKVISLNGKSLRWMEKSFGEAPPGGRSLWISMHGGGGAPAAVNDQQWRNQIQLYTPAEGIYIAPRAPTDTWNLWHESHIDSLFERLIEDHVALRGVNPDRIYLMGYSAGGDGVWQLAPRMADRFAAAAMMAGHPNDASLLGLRNLPFAIFMGGNDSAYQRNQIAADRVLEIDRLEKSDPGGYVHLSKIYEGLGHWMDRKDAEALPWMSKFHRNPWPGKIVWRQDDVVHDRFYWLKIPDKTAAAAGQEMTATVEGQSIRLAGVVPSGSTLRLSDALLDLDREVIVSVNGRQIIAAKVPRTAAAILQSLQERADLPSAATAVWVVP